MGACLGFSSFEGIETRALESANLEGRVHYTNNVCLPEVLEVYNSIVDTETLNADILLRLRSITLIPESATDSDNQYLIEKTSTLISQTESNFSIYETLQNDYALFADSCYFDSSKNNILLLDSIEDLVNAQKDNLENYKDFLEERKNEPSESDID